MTLQVREMRAEDADAVASLMPSLGYSASVDEIGSRLAALREWPDQEAFVAALGGIVVGLSQVQGVRLLASTGYAEVQALVVLEAFQRTGVGRALFQHTVDWCFARGYPRVRVRSGVHRTEAHRFYVAQGFTQSSASYAFELHAGHRRA